MEANAGGSGVIRDFPREPRREQRHSFRLGNNGTPGTLSLLFGRCPRT